MNVHAFSNSTPKLTKIFNQVLPQLVPRLPLKDNLPGAPDLLQKANQHWRKSFWPEPFHAVSHLLRKGDATQLGWLKPESVHLVVTSPPYFNLKKYSSACDGRQLGRQSDYEQFLGELDRFLEQCFRLLVPGGRVCCVIGDVLVSRKSGGRHRILPLPADIMVRARNSGFDTLTPILWLKIGNRTNEAGGGSSGYYGKPYQPGSIIKNDFEHIVMLRKPGGYRKTGMVQKSLSMLQKTEMDAWQRPFWADIRGASLKNGHPAPFPIELAERLIRMYSFAGDTVLDPFAGSSTTMIAAIRAGRNSIMNEIEQDYIDMSLRRAVSELAANRTFGPRQQSLYLE